MRVVAHLVRVLVVAVLVAIWVLTLGAFSVSVHMNTGHGVDLLGWLR